MKPSEMEEAILPTADAISSDFVPLKAGEEISADTLKELSDGKGEDDE